MIKPSQRIQPRSIFCFIAAIYPHKTRCEEGRSEFSISIPSIMIKIVFFTGLVILFVVLTVRTVHFSRTSPPVKECKATDSDFISLSDVMLSRFQNALSIKTVSKDVNNYDREELERFKNFIIESQQIRSHPFSISYLTKIKPCLDHSIQYT